MTGGGDPRSVGNPPPVILLGGSAGAALSIARSLGKRDIQVHLLDYPGIAEGHSRYARPIRLSRGLAPHEAWISFLLGPESEKLRGAVLLACSDRGIEIILDHRAKLAEKFVLDISSPETQRAFLNKLTTYKEAQRAGLDTPLYWAAETAQQVEDQKQQFVYPLLVKPLYSHKFSAVFSTKFFRATDFTQLMDAYTRARSSGLEVLLLEEIPGPDDRLCSFYSYVDETGTPLFAYTKRMVRRFPACQGLGCYHVTDWIPGVRDLGMRLFEHAGLLGLVHVEFKLDHRDGRLKVIECNARFTGANALLAASGYDLASFVYNRLVGLPNESLNGRPYRQGLHLWWPGADFQAFLELRARGELTFRSWVKSISHHQIFPYFRWDDPLPSVVELWRSIKHLGWYPIRRLGGRLIRRVFRRAGG